MVCNKKIRDIFTNLFCFQREIFSATAEGARFFVLATTFTLFGATGVAGLHDLQFESAGLADIGLPNFHVFATEWHLISLLVQVVGYAVSSRCVKKSFASRV